MTIPTTDPILTPGTPFADAVAAVRAGTPLDDAVAGLIAQLKVSEMLGLLDGDVPVREGLPAMSKEYNAVPVEAGRVDRLGIPGIRFTDGPRGVVMGASTAFPAAIARGATWDPDLERRVGDAIGQEARAQGANLFAGVCVNLPPFPGWGRTQESFGEDPVLLGTMGAALTAGVQPWVMACVKHYALNSMEEARFVVDVRVSEEVLHEAYLPHFRTIVESGVDAVMSAYNSVNGTWAGENPALLTDILRGRWGFRGFVMTDFVWGLRHPVESVAAGQDLEMPFAQQRAAALLPALKDGRLAKEDVERAARRLLGAQLRLALRALPTPADDVVASPAHRALAREVAGAGTVLLRNEAVDDGAPRRSPAPAMPSDDGAPTRSGGTPTLPTRSPHAPLLPLDPETVGRVAVVGYLADEANLGDIGSSQVHPPETVSVLAGLRERLGDRVVTVDRAADQDTAVEAAREAEVAVVVVGLGPKDEGEAMVATEPETFHVLGGAFRFRPVARLAKVALSLAVRSKLAGGDRRELGLHRMDVALIRAVAAANPRTVVVVIGGSPIVLAPWDAEVAAVLMAWYPGMEGGRAIADVLLGAVEPGGRLPVALPRRREDLPAVDWLARSVEYPRWWGQRWLDRNGVAAAYPFGFGLGYTTFWLGELEVGPVRDERFAVQLHVANSGRRRGKHVVQVYGLLPGQERPVRVLLGFRAVELEAGESAFVSVECSVRPVLRWEYGRFEAPGGEVGIEVGSWSGDPDALVGTVRVPSV